MADVNALIALGGGRPLPQYDVLESMKNVNMLNKQEREAADYPEERNWLREARGMEREKFGIAKEDRLRELEKRPFKDHVEALNTFIEEIPMITFDKWDASRAWFIRHGMREDTVPSSEFISQEAKKKGVTPEQGFEFFKSRAIPMGKRALEALKARAQVVTAGKPISTPFGAFDPKRGEGGEYVTPPKEAIEAKAGPQRPQSDIGKLEEDKKNLLARGYKPEDPPIKAIDAEIERKSRGSEKETRSAIGRLIDEFNALTPDDPDRPIYEAAIKKATESTGLRVEVGKDGGFTLVQGPGAASGAVSKPTVTKMEEDLIKANDSLQRLSQLDAAFKPEYQELGTRWNAMKSSWSEKLGNKLDPKDEKQLGEYSEYRRRAINNLNIYIKEITGAAMQEEEAKRLMKGMPNPGQGIFDGDSPTEFKSKMKGIMQELRMVSARKTYALKKGMSWEAISLEAMPKVINDRAAELEKELGSKYQGGDLRKAVKERLKKDFGILGG